MYSENQDENEQERFQEKFEEDNHFLEKFEDITKVSKSKTLSF